MNLRKFFVGRAIGLLVVLALVGVWYLFFWMRSYVPSPAPSAANTPIATASYACDNGHTIAAAYYEGAAAATPAEGQPPTPTGSAGVSLDGGATTTLAQTISADGARYSNGDPQIAQGNPGAESLVFWSKGNTALIMRNNAMDPTYTNCAVKAVQ